MKLFIPVFVIFTLLLSGCTKPCGSPEEIATNQCLDKVHNALAKTYKLKLLSSDLGCIVEDKGAFWGISLMGRRGYTLEDVRPLAADIISTYIGTIMSTKEFNTMWIEGFIHPIGPVERISPKSIAIKLAFWDAYFDRYLYPYIAEVRFAYGTVNYYYADPETQKLMPPITETLEELYSHLQEGDNTCLPQLPTNF